MASRLGRKLITVVAAMCTMMALSVSASACVGSISARRAKVS